MAPLPSAARRLQAQNAAMLHVAAAGIATPTPLLARDGRAILSVPLAAAPGAAPRPHAVRMLAFLPGCVMGTAPQVRVLPGKGLGLGRRGGAASSMHQAGT